MKRTFTSTEHIEKLQQCWCHGDFFFFFYLQAKCFSPCFAQNSTNKNCSGWEYRQHKMKKQQLDTVLNIDNAENKRKKPSDDCSLEKQKHPCWTNVWFVSLRWISVGRDTVHSLAEAHLFSYTLLQTPCFFFLHNYAAPDYLPSSTKDGLKVQSSEIIRMHVEWMHSLGATLKRKILRRKIVNIDWKICSLAV